MNILKLLFYEREWLCAYRFLSEEERKNPIPNLEKRNMYHVMNVPQNYWAADPFLLAKGEEVYCFFEYMDTKKKKAVIGAKQILPEEEKEVHVVYEFSGHTSYPCIFEWNNDIYMIPETGAMRSIEMLKCDEWPLKWSKVGALLTDVDTADCTSFIWNGKPYIIIYEVDRRSTKRKLLIGEIDIANVAIKNITECKQYNELLGRPGGGVVFDGNQMIRVVQPGNRCYGEKIEFFDVSFEKKGLYQEELRCEYNIGHVAIDSDVPITRMHTFNRARNVEIIDVLTKDRFVWYRPIKLFLQYLGIFGFDRCDERKKFVNKDFKNII